MPKLPLKATLAFVWHLIGKANQSLTNHQQLPKSYFLANFQQNGSINTKPTFAWPLIVNVIKQITMVVNELPACNV